MRARDRWIVAQGQDPQLVPRQDTDAAPRTPRGRQPDEAIESLGLTSRGPAEKGAPAPLPTAPVLRLPAARRRKPRFSKPGRIALW